MRVFRHFFTAQTQMLEAGLLQAYQHVRHVFCCEAAYLATYEPELTLRVEQLEFATLIRRFIVSAHENRQG